MHNQLLCAFVVIDNKDKTCHIKKSHDKHRHVTTIQILQSTIKDSHYQILDKCIKFCLRIVH